jgi:hypothetical protein
LWRLHGIHAGETLGSNAGNFDRLPVHDDLAAHDPRIGIEAIHPIPVTEHGDRAGIRAIVGVGR